MAFPANDKMLIQLPCNKKVRRVQIQAQIKIYGTVFCYFQVLAQFLMRVSETSIYSLIKGQKAKKYIGNEKIRQF